MKARFIGGKLALAAFTDAIICNIEFSVGIMLGATFWLTLNRTYR